MITLRYPLKRPLFLYVNENAFTGDIRSFVIYLMAGKENREIFKETGFSPIEVPDQDN